MKTNSKITLFVSMLAFVILSFSSQAQDIIKMKSGEEIKAKIVEIDVNLVKYKKFEAQEGTTYSKYKKDIASISYESGEVQDFSSSSWNTQNIDGRNLIGYNYFDLTTLNFSFIYERILTEDNNVSLYIPIRIGFAQSSSYLERPNNYGVGLGVFVYPFGQKKISYFTGPMFMFSNRMVSLDYYDPITGIYMYEELDHNFTSAYVMNGFKLNFNENLGLNFTLGLGFLMDNQFDEIPENNGYNNEETVFHALGEISLFYRFK